MRTRTKIICTIGPAVASKEKMLALAAAGMDGARLNFSHGDHAMHGKQIEMLKEVRRETGRPLAIMLDTRGPEVRVGHLEDPLQLEVGRRYLLGEGGIPLHPTEVLNYLVPGTAILFDDGYIAAQVVEVGKKGVWIEVESPGLLKSRKGVNIPGHALEFLPALTEQDIRDIRFGCSQDVDIIAASFVRSPEQVLAIKALLRESGNPSILVMAKIENAQGVENLDSILHAADGIMVARGDLGVEMPISQVPALQKMMIRKSYMAGKPVATATQMLESMIERPRPTRAEVSDVANAVYDNTSAVMLSGETAVGTYPIQAVQMMKRIIQETEADIDYRQQSSETRYSLFHDIPSSVALASVKTAYAINAAAIFTLTHTGRTARLISRLRPGMPIVALAENEKAYHQMALNWGVIPVFRGAVRSMEEGQTFITRFALEEGIVVAGDQAVLTTGTPFGVSGTTNMMLVETVT